MIVLNQNEFIANLTNLAVRMRVNKTIDDAESPLVASCMFDKVEYGDQAIVTTVDVLPINTYSKTTSLLDVHEPTVDEQALPTTDKKFVTVTLNKYLLTGAFSNEYSMAEFLATVTSMLRKSRNIYMYEKIVSAFEGYIPTKTKQTLTIDLISPAGLTGDALYKVNKLNSMKILREIKNLFDEVTAPTREYNDLGFKTFLNGSNYKLIWNSKFSNMCDVDALADLLNSSKITDGQKWEENYVIPSGQFSSSSVAGNVIGWLCDREKYQIKPRFEVATEFFDGSNLMQNNWLHFWLISGFVNGLNCIKIVANYREVAPEVYNVLITNTESSPVPTQEVTPAEE